MNIRFYDHQETSMKIIKDKLWLSQWKLMSARSHIPFVVHFIYLSMALQPL
jgi:hypothetical protein